MSSYFAFKLSCTEICLTQNWPGLSHRIWHSRHNSRTSESWWRLGLQSATTLLRNLLWSNESNRYGSKCGWAETMSCFELYASFMQVSFPQCINCWDLNFTAGGCQLRVALQSIALPRAGVRRTAGFCRVSVDSQFRRTSGSKES